MVEEVPIEPWKGKSGVNVIKSEDREGFILIEYIRDKRTHEMKEKRTFVPLEHVITLWDIITTNIDVTPEIIQENGFKFPYDAMRKRYSLTFKSFASLLIVNYDIPLNSSKEFFGSRSEAYFPFYYRPMKVLEFYEAVEYTTRKTYRLVESLSDCGFPYNI